MCRPYNIIIYLCYEYICIKPYPICNFSILERFVKTRVVKRIILYWNHDWSLIIIYIIWNRAMIYQSMSYNSYIAIIYRALIESGEMYTVVSYSAGSDWRLDQRYGSRPAVRSVFRQWRSVHLRASKVARGRRRLTRFMDAAMSGRRLFTTIASILMEFILTSLKFPRQFWHDSSSSLYLYQCL